MFDDPYRILGLPPTATDEEVKRAYRQLAKKYHPDMNPGDAHAAKMMNDINAAYDQIKNPPRQTTAQNTYDPFSGWYQNQQNSHSSEYQTAQSYIRMGRYREALHVLSQIAPGSRAAEWYYLSSIANMNVGNRVLAYEHINQACAMEPGNMQYQIVREQIEQRGRAYETEQQGFHFGSAELCRSCLSICICYNLVTCGYPGLFCCF